jgi:hypothetical protein
VIVVHVLRRPHLPHALEVTLVAGLLAILITLLVTGAIGVTDRSAGGPSRTSHAVPAAGLDTAAGWLANPLAPLSSRRGPSAWMWAPRPGPR